MSKKQVEHKSLRVLSLGGGRQSSGLAALAVQGKIKMPDVVLFADTGAEMPSTLEAVKIIFEKMSALGVACETVSNGSILDDARGLGSPPWYVQNDKGQRGMLLRQCTDIYKITPLHRRIRQLAGCLPKQKLRAQQYAMLGISIEEAGRARVANEPWLTLEYPLIELGMTGMDAAIECLKVFGFVPEKSSCFCCPYTRVETWNERRAEDPELFQKAVEVDRRLGELVGKGGLKARPYIHPSTQPLEHATNAQPSLFKQCGGYCWS